MDTTNFLPMKTRTVKLEICISFPGDTQLASGKVDGDSWSFESRAHLYDSQVIQSVDIEEESVCRLS